MKTIGNDIFTVVKDPDRVELFKKLVNEDNVNSLNDCTKHNLLQLAIAYDNVIGAEHLIAKGLDINYHNTGKETALHFCAMYYWRYHKDVLYITDLLLKKGAKRANTFVVIDINPNSEKSVYAYSIKELL